MLSILLYFSCMTAEKAPSDHDLYIQAVAHENPNDALVTCEKIKADSIRGECVLFAAKSAVENRMDGIKFCDASPNKEWRGACLFEVADISGATGIQADAICKQAGDFARRCFYHSLQREENQLMVSYGLGQERQLMRVIQERLSAMNIEELEEEPLSEELCARIIAKRFLNSWRRLSTLPFRQSACGQAPEKVCNAAYRFILKLRQKEGKSMDCTRIPTAQEAIKMGFPGWESTMNNAAELAWRNVCTQMQGQNRKRPDHQASKAR